MSPKIFSLSPFAVLVLAWMLDFALLLSLMIVEPATTQLKTLLDKPGCNLMPGCYNGLSARLIQQHPSGFKIAFMTGFGTAVSQGYPDMGLIGLGNVLEQAPFVVESMRMAAAKTKKDLILCIVDGNTGYSSLATVQRMILNFGAANMVGVLIEDQSGNSSGQGRMKQCSHVGGKDAVPFNNAIKRVKAAVATRDKHKALTGVDGLLILAQRDACRSKSFDKNGLEEGIKRCLVFWECSADITFSESLQGKDKMKEYCDKVEGPKMANLIEGGKTPILSLDKLSKMGHGIAVYPLSSVLASIKAMKKVLDAQAKGLKDYKDKLLGFEELKSAVGFDYYL